MKTIKLALAVFLASGAVGYAQETNTPEFEVGLEATRTTVIAAAVFGLARARGVENRRPNSFKTAPVELPSELDSHPSVGCKWKRFSRQQSAM